MEEDLRLQLFLGGEKKHVPTKIDYFCPVASSELDYGSKHIFEVVVFNNLKLEGVK